MRLTHLIKYFGYINPKSIDKKMKDDYKIKFIRGATTTSGNSIEEIEDAVMELIDELISRNSLSKSNLLSITFTATKDLDACFPASIARKCNGLDSVAFLDCQQIMYCLVGTLIACLRCFHRCLCARQSLESYLFA